MGLNTETKDTKEAFRLVRLSNEAIEADWGVVYPAIANALPPIAQAADRKREGNIKRALLSGALECWIAYKNDKAIVIGTIGIFIDIISGVRSLLLYSLYSYEQINYPTWARLLLLVRNRAKALRASKIIAYTNLERIEELVEALGGRTVFKFVELEV